MNIVVTGIDEAIATLEKAQNIDEPIKEAIHDVIKEASNIVADAYATQGGDGNTDYAIIIEPLPNGWVLRASGGDVGFLEFGAGWGVMPDSFADEVDYDVAVGSYSDISMGQFARTGHRFWWYVDDGGNKHFYRYVNPTRGMQLALNHVRGNLFKAVEEKIKRWIGN